jgi:hypothetical protein
VIGTRAASAAGRTSVAAARTTAARSTGQAGVAAVQGREVEELVDDGAQDGAVAAEDVQHAGQFGGDGLRVGLAQHFDVRGDGGQRGAQFMADEGQVVVLAAVQRQGEFVGAVPFQELGDARADPGEQADEGVGGVVDGGGSEGQDGEDPAAGGCRDGEADPVGHVLLAGPDRSSGAPGSFGHGVAGVELDGLTGVLAAGVQAAGAVPGGQHEGSGFLVDEPDLRVRPAEPVTDRGEQRRPGLLDGAGAGECLGDRPVHLAEPAGAPSFGHVAHRDDRAEALPAGADDGLRVDADRAGVPAGDVDEEVDVAQVFAVQRAQQRHVVGPQGLSVHVGEAAVRSPVTDRGAVRDAAAQLAGEFVLEHQVAVFVAGRDADLDALQEGVEEPALGVGVLLPGEEFGARLRGLVDGGQLGRGPVAWLEVDHVADAEDAVLLVADREAGVAADAQVEGRGGVRHAGVVADVGDDERLPGGEDEAGQRVAGGCSCRSWPFGRHA